MLLDLELELWGVWGVNDRIADETTGWALTTAIRYMNDGKIWPQLISTWTFRDFHLKRMAP